MSIDSEIQINLSKWENWQRWSVMRINCNHLYSVRSPLVCAVPTVLVSHHDLDTTSGVFSSDVAPEGQMSLHQSQGALQNHGLPRSCTECRALLVNIVRIDPLGQSRSHLLALVH